MKTVQIRIDWAEESHEEQEIICLKMLYSPAIGCYFFLVHAVSRTKQVRQKSDKKYLIHSISRKSLRYLALTCRLNTSLWTLGSEKSLV